MIPLLVCILSDGDWEETGRAVRSARRLGLPVLVGQTGATLCGASDAEASVVPIPWHDHFGDARNALTRHARGRYLLWLDSDEELATLPERDWRTLEEPIYAVLIEDHADLAPREALRIVRNDGAVRWRGALHETPRTATRPKGWRAPLLEGLLIRHHGYADEAAIEASLERNRCIVEAERRKGRDDFVLALEEARYAEAFGRGAALLWLRAFNHPKAAPSAPGGYDRRAEPARLLCEHGLTAPALAVLAGNAAIVDLHLALLEAGYRERRTIDDERLVTLMRLLGSGQADTRYSWPKALKDASRDRIIAFVREAAVPAGRRGVENTGRHGAGAAMGTTYRRCKAYDSETLDDELVVMNTESGAVVTLNPTAQAIWQALESGASAEELQAAFRETFPRIAPERLEGDIAATLDRLLAAGLIAADEPR